MSIRGPAWRPEGPSRRLGVLQLAAGLIVAAAAGCSSALPVHAVPECVQQAVARLASAHVFQLPDPLGANARSVADPVAKVIASLPATEPWLSRTATTHPNRVARANLTLIVGMQGPASSSRLLCTRALGDPDPDVRIHAAYVLGFRFAEVAAVPVLLEAVASGTYSQWYLAWCGLREAAGEPYHMAGYCRYCVDPPRADGSNRRAHEEFWRSGWASARQRINGCPAAGRPSQDAP